MIRRLSLAATLVLTAAPAIGDPAVIEAADAAQSGGTWRFSVTLSHGDTGWDDYADGWRVVAENGEVLGVRELLHPHVTEQPFTRSLAGVAIPEGTERVYIEARTNTDGWAGVLFPITLGE